MKWSDIVRVAAVLSFAHKALGFSQPAKSFARSKVVLPSVAAVLNKPTSKLDVLGDNTDVASSPMGDVIFGSSRGTVKVKEPGTEPRQLAGKAAWEAVDSIAYNTVGLVGMTKAKTIGEKVDYDRTVNNVMRRVEADMQLLDVAVGSKPQLTNNEFLFLVACVASAGLSPFLFGLKVAEVLVPVCAAIPAAIGIKSEYAGKTNVFNGKEISALTKQAAMEAEVLMSSAERSKAVVPLCVGVSVTAGSFALLSPPFALELNELYDVPLIPAFYVFWPLISVLSAAVAGLSYQETQSLCGKAIGTGTRRFSKTSDIGRTWLSASEQITPDSEKLKQKITTFVISCLPAPLLALVLPGHMAHAGVICATAAAAQSAFYLAGCEYEIARALDAVALKTRAAAISETYANQGARSGAILPFTSALGGVCAAGAAAAVELLPLIHNVGAQAVVSVIFPSAAAVVAAAASVAKVRTEVNAVAAKAASEIFGDANRLASTDDEKTSIGATTRGTMEPMRGVIELVQLAKNSVVKVAKAKTRNLRNRFGGGGNAALAAA